MTDACVVLVTCGSAEEAEKLSGTIVLEGLAACVNVVGGGNPICSFYMWEEKLQKADEHLLIIKTFFHKLEALEARIKELHSYTIPEFVALPAPYVAKNYIQWMTECIK